MGKNVLSTLFGCVKPKAAGENGRKNVRSGKKNKVHQPKEQQAKLQPKVEKEIQRPRVEELISLEDNLSRKEEFLSHQLAAACVSLSFGPPNAGGPALINRKKQLRLEIASLRAMITSSRAELANYSRARLHAIEMELERASQNSNAAAAASTSVCASISVPEQVGDSLTVRVGPESVQDHVSGDNLFPGTHVVQDILGSLIGEVEVGRKFDISSAFAKEDSPLNCSTSTQIPSIDIKTAIPIEESSCISTEIPGCSTSKVDADKEKPEEQVDKESKDEDLKMMKERVKIKWLNLHEVVSGRMEPKVAE